jgi:hypothetical protein
MTAAWLSQNWQLRAARLSRDQATRQALYKQFIDEASKLYADALEHDEAGIMALSSIYALINRNACPVEFGCRRKGGGSRADHVYFAPNKTVPDLPTLIESQAVDPLRPFSDQCRSELERLKHF